MKKSLYYIVEFLLQFDRIGIVELRKNVDEVTGMLHLVGPSWGIVYSDYVEDPGGEKERVGFVLCIRPARMLFTGLAGNANEAASRRVVNM